MTWEKAVKWCEEHECTECDIYLKGLDKRTKEERYLHVPCYKNLVTEDTNKFKKGIKYESNRKFSIKQL